MSLWFKIQLCTCYCGVPSFTSVIKHGKERNEHLGGTRGRMWQTKVEHLLGADLQDDDCCLERSFRIVSLFSLAEGLS